jgi:tripartite-type tricarboxylate transporter receptor subunit TctC
MNRRTFLGATTGSLIAAVRPASAQSAASAWPTRTVRVIVPYPAGGSTDVLARIFAERLEKKFGQPWIIDNRPGAGGNIGIDAVVRSEPDGYTIGAATVGHFSINQYLYRRCRTTPSGTSCRCP